MVPQAYLLHLLACRLAGFLLQGTHGMYTGQVSSWQLSAGVHVAQVYVGFAHVYGHIHLIVDNASHATM